MPPEKANAPFEARLKSLPELSWSTRPWPLRPVRVPPTLYLPVRLQPTIATPAAATVIHASVFTKRLPRFDPVGESDSGPSKSFLCTSAFHVKKCVAQAL